MRGITCGLVLFATLLTGAANAKDPESAKSVADDAKELAAVQGKWVRTIKTNRGPLKLIKEHRGKRTTLTIYDERERVVAAKESEFRLSKTGQVRIFTFFNNVTTAGPDKGATDKKPKSYIYKIKDDTFFEANGFLADDDSAPNAFSWQRVR